MGTLTVEKGVCFGFDACWGKETLSEHKNSYLTQPAAVAIPTLLAILRCDNWLGWDDILRWLQRDSGVPRKPVIKEPTPVTLSAWCVCARHGKGSFSSLQKRWTERFNRVPTRQLKVLLVELLLSLATETLLETYPIRKGSKHMEPKLRRSGSPLP